MKKILMIFTITGALTALSVTAFAQQDKKVAKAKKEVVEAEKDLTKAKIELTEATKDSAADYQRFRNETAQKISENDKKIAELKAKRADEIKEDKAKYDAKVVALEQKNNELKRKAEGSETVKTSAWTSFKREFNHDMDELGKALKDITVDNKK